MGWSVVNRGTKWARVFRHPVLIIFEIVFFDPNYLLFCFLLEKNQYERLTKNLNCVLTIFEIDYFKQIISNVISPGENVYLCTFLCVNMSCCVIKIHAHGVSLRTYLHKLPLGGLTKIPTQLTKRNFVERKTMAIPYILNSGPRVPPSSLGRRSIVNEIRIAAFSHMQYSLLCNSCTVYILFTMIQSVLVSQYTYIDHCRSTHFLFTTLSL